MSAAVQPRIVWARISRNAKQSVFDTAELIDNASREAGLIIPSAQQVMLLHAVRELAVACRECGLPDTVALVVSEK